MRDEFLIRGRFLNEDVERLVSAVHDHFDCSTKNLNIKFTDRRSLTANSQVWVWAQQVAKQIGDDVNSVYCRMKRDQGLPILLSDHEHGPVADYILKQTNFYQMSEERQIKIIGAMEVTRKLSTRQHNEFRDNVQLFYNQHGFNLQYIEREDG